MERCGKLLAKPPATIPRCGSLWCGSIIYCDECEDKNLDREYKKAIIKLAQNSKDSKEKK